MIPDILQAVQAAIDSLVAAGLSPVTPSPGATGTVALAPSSKAFGTSDVLLQVLSSGPVGSAQAQISLDAGNSFGAPFTIPAQLQVPLNPSQVLSGLVLNFSGSFTANDSYAFSAAAQVTYLTGAENVAAADSIFPRVIWVPLDDDFAGTEDYALGQTQATQPGALVTAVARFQAHIWGESGLQTELLRNQVINGLHLALLADKRILRGEWVGSDAISRAGSLYVLTWTVKIPVLKLTVDTTVVQPPFTAAATPEVDSP